jgi:hypothetical protein
MAEHPANSNEPRNQHSGPRWWNPWNWPAGIWALFIGAAVMIIPIGIRTVMLSGVPAIQEPFDVNAFIQWDVPPDQDAFTEYRLASVQYARIVAELKSQGIEGGQVPEDCTLVLDKGWSAADESVAKWLEMYRGPLAVWRRGTTRQKGLNLSPDQIAFDSVLTTVQDQRMFTRMALCEEARLLEDGKLDEARQWARASFRSGGHTSHRGCLIQALVGAAIHAMSSEGLARWAEESTVTSEQLKQALNDVRSDFTLYEATSNVLKVEYMALRNTFSSPAWSAMISPVNPGNPAAASQPMKMGYWIVGEPELTLRIARQLLANQIQEIDKPVSLRRKTAGAGVAMMFDPDPTVSRPPGQLDPAGIDRGINRSTLMRMLVPMTKQYDTAMLRQAARQVALEVLLAAQAYRRDHAEFPQTLQALIPDYLDSIPLDPFDPAGGTLLYRRDEASKAVVWSLGDDQGDHGGNVTSPDGRPTDVGFLLK